MKKTVGTCRSIHTFTHTGQREENQDRLAVLHAPDGSATLLVVADGLGGHRGGAVAAKTVVDTAEAHWATYSAGQDANEFLQQLVRRCEAAVRMARDAYNNGMTDAWWLRDVTQDPRLLVDPHSTIAALLVSEAEAVSVHAGDSRILQFSEDALIERTLDHSVAQLHVLRGLITEEEMADHPDQNTVFSQIGGKESAEMEVGHWDLAKGRRFVLCSDGFWEIFRPEEMLELFSSPDPESELAQRFERKLEVLEKHDNTTAILAQVELVDETFAGKDQESPNQTSEKPTVATTEGKKAQVPRLPDVLTRHPAVFGLALLMAFIAAAVLLWPEHDESNPLPIAAPSTNQPALTSSEATPAPRANRGTAPVDEAPNPESDAAPSEGQQAVPRADAQVELHEVSGEDASEKAPAAMVNLAVSSPESQTVNWQATLLSAESPSASDTRFASDMTLKPSTADPQYDQSNSAESVEHPAASETNLSKRDATASSNKDTVEDSVQSNEKPATRPVPLESTNLEVSLPLEPGSEPAEVAAEVLRQRGQLGDEDVLLPGGSHEVGDSLVSHAQQRHQDIPVYAAEVRVVVREGRIVSIFGQPAPNIRLDTITPENDYPATIALAESLLAHGITPEDEGLLVIFATGTAYRLAWRGVVVIDQLQEEAVFDAETGDVLLRVPLVHHTDDSPEDAGL